MSRPERVFTWHIHWVLNSSLIRDGDVNVFVDDDVAELVHYRHTAGTGVTVNEDFISAQMTRFKWDIMERLQNGIKICPQ